MINSRAIRRLSALATCMTILAVPANANAQEQSGSFEKACSAFQLTGAAANETLVSARFEAADKRRPAYCLLRASITTSPGSRIDFRVDLPETASWNDKLLTIGGGGFDGYISLDGIGFDLWQSFVGYQGPNLGSYVLVSTDSGHQGRGAYPAFDMSWADRNPDAMTNHAYRANHLVLGAAVRIAKQFYGREPARRYIVGGSNGGRQGLMAAQHYPDDYHGIVALMPAISQTAVFANMAPVFQHIYKDPDNWLGADALALYTKAEIAACDGLDGLSDGVINNYKACRYDGAPLACPERRSDDAEACLTPGQIETIRLVRADKAVDAPFADGMRGYPGFGPGALPSAWVAFLTGSSFEKRDASLYLLANQQVKILTGDPNADIMTFDPSKWRDQIADFSRTIDTTNPDLSAFFAKGGKIIVWHGVADTAVSYRRTDEYVATVERRLGTATTRKSLRYFVSPAVDHYLQGTGANIIPFLARLEDWVERGRAPDKMVATRLDPSPALPTFELAGTVAFTRPLCEYGTFPKYVGKGDRDKASSFACSRD